jgi:TonB-dependent starch-binding outer membrane protein SusC
MNLRKLLLTGLPAFFLLLATVVHAQTKQVSGRVTDANGVGLAGVTVTAKGTNTVTTTNESGSFSIAVPQNATALIFTSIGFERREVELNNQSTVNVSLVAAASNLNEIVVVGYGTQRRRDLTGSIATVSSKDFVKGPITSPEQLITGKVAGVQITSNGGAPGEGARIRIRGGTSLNASNDPLIVIDNVPVEGGVAGSANILNLINPNDIESFTILKDPSAAAIYGSRAANGVILITTKKGGRGPVRFNVSNQFFVQTPTNKVDMMNGDEIRQLVAANGTSADVGKLGNTNTDWQDEIYDNATGNDLNISARGGAFDGKLPFRISGNYLNQDGILRTGNFQRLSLGINLSPKFLNDKLSVNFNLKEAFTKNRFADGGAIGTANIFDPTQPVRVNSNRFGGFFEYIDFGSNILPLGRKPLTPANPVGLLEQRENNSEVYRTLGNLQLDYQLPWVKGLRANLNLGLDFSSGKGTDIINDSAGAAYNRRQVVGTTVVNSGGQRNQYESKSRNKLVEFYLNYNRELKNINSQIDLTAGYGYQDFKFTNPAFPSRFFNGKIDSTSIPQFDVDYPQYTLISYYGRLNYTLANKYVLTLNARTDGISRFNPDDRWGFFSGASFAWRLNQENFLKNSKTISDLKLRIGYGETGQQNIGALYAYLARYTVSGNTNRYQLGNTYYNMYRPEAYDPNLRWETTTNLNLAVDFGFFKNRLTGSVELFDRRSKDLLSVVPVPLGTNFAPQLLTNVGELSNKGIEVSLNATPVLRPNFSWEISSNFSYIVPEVEKLLINTDPTFKGVRVGGIDGGTGNRIQIQAVGNNPNAFYVFKQIYDQSGRPIEGLYEDLNRDGIINDNDLYIYKRPDPLYLMGLSSNLNYKKFSAGFTLRGSFDNYMYNNIASNFGVTRNIINPIGIINNGHRDYFNTGFRNNQYFSDYYIQNASFVRMENINIGYNAGEVWKRANLRIGLGVQNAFVITDYKGVDPEINGGIDNSFYVRPRTYTLSLNLDF